MVIIGYDDHGVSLSSDCPVLVRYELGKQSDLEAAKPQVPQHAALVAGIATLPSLRDPNGSLSIW